jgi:hypothetical protein
MGFGIFSLFSLYLFASLYKTSRLFDVFLIVFAPATVINFLFGQTGFLSSALIIGGFRVVTSRPILSGTLFGLASFKPQLGILIPIALISARLWRTMAAAGVTVLLLVLASSLVFGWSNWPIWLAKLVPHTEWSAAIKPQYMPTIIANLAFLGVDLSVARVVQLAVAVAVSITIWACFRRGVTNLGISALLVGTFLATPYAFVYDMPMLTNAILWVIHDEARTRRLLPIPQVFILVLSTILPILMAATWRFGAIRSIPLILLFGLIVWHIVGARRGVAKSQAAPPAETVGVG